VFKNGVNADSNNLSQKELMKLGDPIEILEYIIPENNFIVLESVTRQNIRIIHMIKMRKNYQIKVGRGHEADIRVTDISVSRFHAMFN
jgi:pSer/pThr/pTyr-binding forkhead associated (FHA) protein